MSRRNRFLVVGLVILLGFASYETHILAGRGEHIATARAAAATLDQAAVELRHTQEATRRELAEAERQLAALPRAATGAWAVAPPRPSVQQAWLGRVKQLQQLFAEEPARRIPEMRFLQESDWVAPAQFPFENETQLRMALAQVREAARKRFRPLLAAALRKYEVAGGSGESASPLVLAPYFDPPVERALLEQYEFTSVTTMRTGVRAPRLGFQPKAPVDPLFEIRSPMDSEMGGGVGNGSPVAWVPDFNARMKNATAAYAAAKGADAPVPSLPALVRYFDPPLPADLVEGYVAYEREMARRR